MSVLESIKMYVSSVENTVCTTGEGIHDIRGEVLPSFLI